jgi:hypothetical protein
VDPSKLATAFKLTDEDEALQSPLRDLSSATERLTMTEPTPFVVTEDLSKGYYKGLPSNPPLIATTNSGPFESPSGLEAQGPTLSLKS